MSHDDFDFEPQRGLPALLPVGETLLWQGSPNWRSLAVHGYHVRKVAIYFLLLLAWRVGVGIFNGHSGAAMALSCAFLGLLGLVAIGMLSLLAYFTARETVYSITSRRILLRHGVAVPMTMNIPFSVIQAADVKTFTDGTGDVSVMTQADQRVGYLITWPHLRPGFITRPQPSFRSLPDARHAAAILGDALTADGSQSHSPHAGVAPARIAATA